MPIIHYIIELHTKSTITDSSHGFVNGVLRVVTDRPVYTGSGLTYGPSEIDVDGNDVSNNTNTNTYYPGFIIKDGIDGNCITSIDITQGGSYGNEGSFSFKLRGDKVGGSYFWQFCKTNSIILTNAIVLFYAVIDDVMWQQWRGRVSNNPYTDEDFEIQCKDESLTIHRVIPPLVDNIYSTGSTTVDSNTSGATPASNQNVQQVVIPVVFGDVAYSPIAKLTDQNTFIDLQEENGSTTIFAPAYHYVPGTESATLYLITNGIKFIENDPSIVDSFLIVESGKNADTEQAYRILSNQASYSNDASINFNTITPIVIDGNLVGSDKTLILNSDFDSTDTVDKYSKYISAGGTSPQHASDNTWYFKISSFTIDTILSTDTINIQKNDRGQYIVYVYDSGTKTYVDISSHVSLDSSGTSLKLISNLASIDGKIQIMEDLDFPILGYWVRDTQNINEHDAVGYTSGIVNGTQKTTPAQIATITDKSRLTSEDFGVTLTGKQIYFVSVRYKTKPVAVDYDRIFFLLDLTVTGGSGGTGQPFRFTSLIYSLFDISGRIINKYNKNVAVEGTTLLGNYGHATVTPSPYNLISNDYYNLTNIAGDSTSRYLASGSVINSKNYPGNLFFDFDKAVGGSKSDVVSKYVDTLEARIGLWNFNNWQYNLDIAIKQASLLGVRNIDTITGDLFVKTIGETTDSTATNDVYHTFKHILEDYDEIPSKLINYGNLPNYRSNWHVGRTLTEQRNAVNYLNELSSQSFVGLYPNRKGQREFRCWLPGSSSPSSSFTPSTGTGKTSSHDGSNIIDESIEGLEKTDFAQVYNSFQLKYNYDPGSELYNEFINVCNIDSDHTSFPVSSGNWQSYVTGVPDSAYSDASNIWTECINSFKDNQVTQIASTQISELPWYVDAKIFDSNATNGTGTTSSAFYYLKFLGYWTTRLKDVITYSIPITTNTVGTDILDCVTVKNAVYTDGTARTGWIVSRELDAVNDLLILQAMLLPADMSTSLTKFDYLDERPDKNVYIDSLDQRSAGTDSLTE